MDGLVGGGENRYIRDSEIPQDSWFDNYQYDVRADPKAITMGYRKKTIASCQYYVNNLPIICGYWTNNGCGYDGDDGKPSGYNNGHCDFMGRRARCNKYTGGNATDPEYHCVAINPFLSGLFDVDGKPLSENDVLGYNGGACDGLCCGRGEAGGDVALEELIKQPVVCNYYRPWQMSVGLTVPQSYESLITKYGPIRSYSADYYEALRRYTQDHSMGARLPFYFTVCNMRARTQKCLYWDSDYGAEFVLAKDSGDNYHIDMTAGVGPGSPCLKAREDDEIKKFVTVADHSTYWLLRHVWAEAGGVVCNGARPDCPCYSGEWRYCTNDAMENGMRVTANQLMELRFWTNDWDSQQDYDDYFSQRPNWVDTTTADLLTFTKYTGSAVHESGRLMLGKKLHMCMPANIWNKYFDPTVYIESTDVQFAGGDEIGTASTGGYYFPTLMREAWGYKLFNKFFVAFPFVNNEFQDETNIGCELDDRRPTTFEKYTNNPEFDFISAIGQTIRNKKIYLINSTIAGRCGALDGSLNVTTMSYKDRVETGKQLQSYLEDTKVEYPDAIREGFTDSIAGVFIVGPVRLKVNAINSLLILVELGTYDFDFRHRLVYCRFGAGTLQQTEFSNPNEEKEYESLMMSFDPPATAAGEMVLFGVGCDPDMYPAHSMHVINMLGEYDVYAYSVDKETVGEDMSWTPLGNSSYVLAYLKDSKINHIFRWGVTSATMTYTKGAADEHLEGACSEESIEMVAVFPSNNTVTIIVDGNNYEYKGTSFTSTQEQGFVIPGIVLLKPKNPEHEYHRFSKLSWELELEAWSMVYNVTESSPGQKSKGGKQSRDYDNSTTEGRSRTGMSAGKKNGKDMVKVPYNLTVNGSTFTVTDFAIGPVGVVGFVKDPRDRYLAASAIKVYVYASYARCRSIEVNHVYKSSGPEEALNPWKGWALAPGGGMSSTGRTRYQSYHVRCGDHLMSMSTGKGPMWYPHSDCARADIYEVWAMCAYCVAPYEGIPRDDMRFCMTQAEVVYGETPRSNWASACGIQCYFLHAAFNDDTFGGYANIVASVDAQEYMSFGWRLPPFGNFARDFIDRNLCKDYIVYVAPYPPIFRSAWAPTIADDTMFNMSFNVFDSYSATNASDVFSFSDTLNYGLCANIGEVYDSENRYNWDEIFNIRFFISGFYPKPMVPHGIGYVAGVGYVFNDQDVAWAWREFWVPIKRAGTLPNVHLLRPAYRSDLYKREHRYITDEGPTSIKFTAPTREESEYSGDYPPTIALGDGPPRMFQFLYDSPEEYDGSRVAWLDDYDGGNTVYSQTTGSTDFDHDYDVIFDTDYSSSLEEADEAGRARIIGIDEITGEEIKKAYNRGIICIMRRRDLCQFPLTTTIGLMSLTNELPPCSERVSVGPYTWLPEEGGGAIVMIGSPGDEMAIRSVTIEGSWGKYDDETYFCQPTVSVSIRTPEGKSTTLGGFGGASSRAAGDGGMESYTITLSYKVTPYDLVLNRATEVTISFGFVSGEGIAVDLPSFELADQWESVEEEITVYERKYFVSRFTQPGKGPNPDTYEGTLIPRNRGGDYFPYETGIWPDGYTAMNKMRGCWAGKHYEWLSKEPLSISIGTMTKIESEEQQKIYEQAVALDVTNSDVLMFVASPPPYFKALQELVNSVDTPMSLDFLNMTFNSPVLKWDNFKGFHKLYKVYEHWKPGGHTWGWGTRVTRQNCKLFDVNRNTQHP